MSSSFTERPRTTDSGTPSPVAASVDEDERLGDDEMMAYIKRQQMKKLTSGAKKEELDAMFKFPEPIPPTPPDTPACELKALVGFAWVIDCSAALLKSNRVAYLSEYERREVLDFPQVYFYGQGSEKKMATTDNSTNNYGYDDERGDYIIIDHDHLHYRYEVITTLGKGSFGQVLQCRDHCTGQSVAVKIIRNKKRFHHQALVEIKILENLRKWVRDDDTLT
jgi:dual specificity tyrosine-phosphorylation-regulated kinase 2/3/4